MLVVGFLIDLAGVVYAQRCMAQFLIQFDAEFPFIGDVLRRVLHQYGDQPLELIGVAIDGDVGLELIACLNIFSAEYFFKISADRLCHFAEIDRFDIGDLIDLFQTVEGEQLSDKLTDTCYLSRDIIEPFAFAVFIGEHLRVSGDNGDRCFYLMTRVGDELLLHARVLFKRLDDTVRQEPEHHGDQNDKDDRQQ